MAVYRIRGVPFSTITVGYEGEYRFRVRGLSGWFKECIPGTNGEILCYTRCSDMPHHYRVDEDTILTHEPVRPDRSILEHYAKLLRGTSLEPIVDAMLTVGNDDVMLRRLLEAVISAAMRSKNVAEKQVAVALVWPLPCHGLVLEEALRSYLRSRRR